MESVERSLGLGPQFRALPRGAKKPQFCMEMGPIFRSIIRKKLSG